jgi:hypothetical protein
VVLEIILDFVQAPRNAQRELYNLKFDATDKASPFLDAGGRSLFVIDENANN